MKKILALIISLVFSLFVFAQKENSVLFKNGDRVCFVGNSITHSGEFHSNIFLYYATRFPKENVSFFNCGIAGDVVGGVISRMDSDILVHRPTVAVVMIGMNDVSRNLYAKINEKNPEIDKKKAEALENYKKNTTKIADIFSKYGCKQILQLPTIYDQTAKISTENLFGVNDALGKCAEHLKSIAPASQAIVIDYYTILKTINDQGQKKDSTYTIIGNDRVHPQSPGHLVMAYQFLKTTGAPKYVSKISIDAGKKKVSETINCEVKIKSSKKNKIEFECIENALPFPVRKAAIPALSLVPFVEDLNQEVLQVGDLESGNYDLLIDQIHVGSYTSFQLEKGINLAGDTLTPQYRQSLRVMDLCNEYRTIGSNLRNIAYIEFKNLDEYKGKITDFEALKAFLNEKMEKTANAWIRSNFEQYQVNKPKQAYYEAQLEEIRNKIYQTNIPASHTFELIKN